ncbi:hypothetical protein GH810_02840 [Acetobacterium paludosum]|uniref:Uncharacterized protein n=1 Tax=Acetobacterium paludosum TaxID=52693 RepID=A0A923HWI8_9FIRM|nr:hypothetical protein [Acetobacterium paludosum]MBC3887246.1 hypothetical protein [Acetobacterium paludosum]
MPKIEQLHQDIDIIQIGWHKVHTLQTVGDQGGIFGFDNIMPTVDNSTLLLPQNNPLTALYSGFYWVVLVFVPVEIMPVCGKTQYTPDQGTTGETVQSSGRITKPIAGR